MRRLPLGFFLLALLFGCAHRPVIDQCTLVKQADGITWTPMEVASRPLIVAALGESLQPIRCIVDTGSTRGLILSERRARSLGMRLSDATITSLTTNSGVVQSRSLENTAIAIGTLVDTVPLDVVEKGPEAILGQEWLRQSSGVIFDWPRNRSGIIPRGGSVPVAPGWVELPLLRVFFGDPAAEAPANIRPNRLIVRSVLGGLERRCQLDTGFSGDLLSNGDVEPAGKSRRVQMESLGAVRRAALGDAPGVLELGPLNFSGLTLLAYPADDTLRLHSITAGLGVLRRYPLWIDYDNAIARFWVGDGAPPFSNGGTGGWHHLAQPLRFLPPKPCHCPPTVFGRRAVLRAVSMEGADRASLAASHGPRRSGLGLPTGRPAWTVARRRCIPSMKHR